MYTIVEKTVQEERQIYPTTFHVSYFYSCFADATVVQTQSIHSNIFKHQGKKNISIQKSVKISRRKKQAELPSLETSIELQMLSSVQVNLNCLCHIVVLVIVFVFVFVSIIVFLLVRSYFLITLSKCFKSHKCLGSLFVFQNVAELLSQSVTGSPIEMSSESV